MTLPCCNGTHAARDAGSPSQRPRGSAQAQLDQLVEATLVRSDRLEAQASDAAQWEGAGRTSRASQGVPPLGPPEKVHETFDCKPTSCRRCGDELQGDDPAPLIHQVAELPMVEPIFDEYRLHRLVCPGCGKTTCGTLPPGVPRGGFGPYLQAVMAVFAGAYRLSKRQLLIKQVDVTGLGDDIHGKDKVDRGPVNSLAPSPGDRPRPVAGRRRTRGGVSAGAEYGNGSSMVPALVAPRDPKFRATRRPPRGTTRRSWGFTDR